MFTGIVQGLCEVVGLEDQTNLRRLRIAAGSLAEGAELGASVAVNGTCLTVTAVDAEVLAFDVIRETLNLTNLGALTVGRRVNLERSYRVGDEVGGHVLSGHVTDTVGVSRIEQGANARDVFFAVPSQWMKYLPYKGFVALDGASLTIASVDAEENTISVSLIPETIARTTLGTAAVGDRVNLEVDAQTQAVVDTVERLLSSKEWRDRLSA